MLHGWRILSSLLVSLLQFNGMTSVRPRPGRMLLADESYKLPPMTVSAELLKLDPLLANDIYAVSYALRAVRSIPKLLVSSRRREQLRP